MASYTCIVTTNRLADIGYFSHEQLNSKCFSEFDLHLRQVIYGTVGHYIIYRFSCPGGECYPDWLSRADTIRGLRTHVNNMNWAGNTHVNGNTPRYDRIVIAKYTDDQFTQQIDIALNDPVFNPRCLKFSDKLQTQLDAYNAEI